MYQIVFQPLVVLFISILVLLILGVMYFDMKYMKIPNWLNEFIVCLFFLFAPWNFSLINIFYRILFSVCIFLICAALFYIGIFGGGDAKFLSAISLWIGHEMFISYFILFAILGLGLISVLFFLSYPYKGREIDANKQVYLIYQFMHHRRVPYGIPMGIACILFIEKIFFI